MTVLVLPWLGAVGLCTPGMPEVARPFRSREFSGSHYVTLQMILMSTPIRAMLVLRQGNPSTEDTLTKQERSRPFKAGPRGVRH